MALERYRSGVVVQRPDSDLFRLQVTAKPVRPICIRSPIDLPGLPCIAVEAMHEHDISVSVASTVSRSLD